jgi:hypothetical protein
VLQYSSLRFLILSLYHRHLKIISLSNGDDWA